MVDVTHSWINTNSGKVIDLLAPMADQIDIMEIAHSLSRICRYGGHCKDFYSVAQHCVLVSLILEGTGYELEGLLHDASEAYIGDLVAPLKQLWPEYLDIELRFEAVIAKKFDLLWENGWNRHIKDADWTALAAEKKSLLPNSCDWPFPEGLKTINDEVRAIPTEAAEELFLTRYRQLTTNGK